MTLRLASFDLDGTLIHPAIFNAVAEQMGFADKLEETTLAYFEGRMTAEETFRKDFIHFVGRDVQEMHDALRKSTSWTPGIAEAFGALHEAGLRIAVTTDQPDFLATITKPLFGVDDVICTPAELKHGRVMGQYELRSDKWANLARLLNARRIRPEETAHVGNGSNDVPIFQKVGLGVAVFAMNGDVKKAARVDLGRPKDMREVADAILAHL